MLRRCLLAGLLALAGTGERIARAQSPESSRLAPSIAVGDWRLTPSLELRSRAEYRRDSPDLAAIGAAGPTRDTFGVLERTRLGVGAEYGASRDELGFLRIQLTLQDARAWGTQAPGAIPGAESSSASSTSLYEGFIEARTSAARPAYVRIGRQAVTWGDGRLLSNADWSPQARTLDAIRGHASAGMFDIELLAAILQAPSPIGAAFGQTPGPASSGTELYGAQIAASPAPLFKLELSFVARVRRSPQVVVGDGETYVGSLRVFGGANGWRYAIEGAAELERPVTSSQATPAWAGAGYVEKTLDTVVLSPTLRLEGDAATGQSPIGNGAHGQFDPLLPDVHSLHGAMDLFAWSNTLQGSARVSIVPWAEGVAAVEYRYVRLLETGFWLDSYLSPLGFAGAGELGSEVDAWASWRPWPVLDVGAGYSLLAISDEARAALQPQSGSSATSAGYAASLAHFAYVQATVRVP